MSFPYPDSGDWRDIPIFDELTSPDVAAAAEAGAHVVVPFGATEQHAGHLPLGTDTYQSVDIARRAAATLNPEGVPLLVGPAVPFGPSAVQSESPRDFSGSIYVSHATLHALSKDICLELVRQGFKVIYLICGHAESDPVLQLVAKEVSEETDASVLTVQWLIGAQPDYGKIKLAPGSQGHAGEGETARMLASAPHLVRMDKCVSYRPALPTDPARQDRMPYLGGAIGRYKYPPEVFEGFEDGLWGDPDYATAETGEAYYKVVNEWICDVIRKEYAMWRRSA
ncbi:creatininase family protein [Pseudoroseicyclus tamaricis]|uniref:Creatininase family protein n=1 Tax=Pseudoroseicyclus tamaricis TaxID=2705421 RepID=A0A6B2JYQ7_9RHOB|nr:creatininase family protein [Pseudoroseicyclus tamaricis]NDV00502.1 creatininase family protein [Pseudoroseicyclus tamaricis]